MRNVVPVPAGALAKAGAFRIPRFGGTRQGAFHISARRHFCRCLFTSFVISNMFTVALPPKTDFSVASALIMRLFF